MLAQSLLFPVLALAAFASASPLQARSTPKDATCPQPGSTFFAIPPKHYLYGVYCDTKYEGGNVNTSRVANLLDCANACDAFTDNNSGQLCHAANFQPGTSHGHNCELHYKSLDDDETDILPYDVPGFESVQVTVTKVTSIN